MLKILPACAALLILAFAAHAEPRKIDDCEKIQAADAYNQCLASFGPAAHEHDLSQDAPAAGAGRPVAHGRRHAHRGGTRHVHTQLHAQIHVRSGRKHVEISLKGRKAN